MSNKYARFYALLKELNSNGLTLTKDEAVLSFTGGKTTSLSSLSPKELMALEADMVKMRSTSKQVPPAIGGRRDQMRKAIISQFKSIGRTTQQAIAWAEKYGVNGNKKKFNDYDEGELFLLIKNAEHVKRDFLKTFNRG